MNRRELLRVVAGAACAAVIPFGTEPEWREVVSTFYKGENLTDIESGPWWRDLCDGRPVAVEWYSLDKPYGSPGPYVGKIKFMGDDREYGIRIYGEVT